MLPLLKIDSKPVSEIPRQKRC